MTVLGLGGPRRDWASCVGGGQDLVAINEAHAMLCGHHLGAHLLAGLSRTSTLPPLGITVGRAESRNAPGRLIGETPDDRDGLVSRW